MFIIGLSLILFNITFGVVEDVEYAKSRRALAARLWSL